MLPFLIQSQKFLSPQSIIDQAGLAFGMQVADFGCGTGDFALAAARAVGADGQVSAIDIQDSALSSARSKARMAGVLNIRLIKANLEVYKSSALPDESQDAVFLTNILFQTENKNDIIKESFRVSREGGTLVFVDWLKEADFGPARGWRLGKEEAKAMIEKEGFVFKKEIGAGAFHFGMVFSK